MKESRKRNQKISNFASRVLGVVSRIPRGCVLSYKEVAGRAGKPKAYRAVGTIVSKNYDPLVPCHRVITQDGHVGGYNRGKVRKVFLLRCEGLKIARSKVDIKVK